MKKGRVSKLLSAILQLSIFASGCYCNVIDGPVDLAGTPRDLTVFPITIGNDASQTTSVVNHVLIRVSDSTSIFNAPRLAPRREGTILVLQNSDMILDGNYTLSVVALKVVGDCQITGTPGSKLILQGPLLQVMSGSSLKIGPNVELLYTPTSEVFETGNSPRAGTMNAIRFQGSDSQLILCDATLTISNDIGARFIGGNLVIEGDCIIDNATTDTEKALFLGASITDTKKSNKNVGDCNLIIKKDSKLTVKNAGIELRNRGVSHFLGANGDGLLEIENSPGNFLFDQTVDFNGSGIGFSSAKLAGKTLRGKVLNSSLTTVTLFNMLPNSSRTPMDWSPDGKFLAVSFLGQVKVLRLDGSTVQEIASVGITNLANEISWSPDGRFFSLAIDAGGGAGTIKIFSFNGTSLTEVFSSASDSRVISTHWSNDGAHIAFGRIASAGGSEIFSVKALGGGSLVGQLELGDNDNVGFTQWTPDSQLLAVATSGGVASTAGIRILKFNGVTAPIIHTTALDNIISGEWSPDGRHLLVGTQTLLNLYRFDGLQLTLITSISSSDFIRSVDWSPDGKYVVIGTDISTELVRVFEFVNGEVLNELGNLQTVLSDGGLIFVKWSPDGNFIAAADEDTFRIFRVPYGDLEAEARFDNSTIKLHKDMRLESLKLRLS